MDWKGYDKLKSVLKGSPIAVTYSMEPDPRGKEGRHWVLAAYRKPGREPHLSRETSSCSSGVSIWPGTPTRGGGQGPQGISDSRRKVCSLATVARVRSLTLNPPLGMADVLIAPLEEAEEKPDLVIFLVNMPAPHPGDLHGCHPSQDAVDGLSLLYDHRLSSDLRGNKEP